MQKEKYINYSQKTNDGEFELKIKESAFVELLKLCLKNYHMADGERIALLWKKKEDDVITHTGLCKPVLRVVIASIDALLEKYSDMIADLLVVKDEDEKQNSPCCWTFNQLDLFFKRNKISLPVGNDRQYLAEIAMKIWNRRQFQPNSQFPIGYLECMGYLNDSDEDY